MKPNSISQKKQKKQKLKKKNSWLQGTIVKQKRTLYTILIIGHFGDFLGTVENLTPLYLSLPYSWLNIKKAHCVKGTLGSSEIPRQCDNSSVTKNCSVEVSIIMLNYHTKKQSQATIKPFWRYSMLKHEAMAERRLSS